MYSPEEIEHGRRRREKRSWEGVAGQQSPVIQEMKERMDKGEMSVGSEEEPPWYTPGKSLNGNGPDGNTKADHDESDEEKSGTDDPDAGKWGRAIRDTPPET